MFCEQCGSFIQDGESFCSNCGAAVNQSTSFSEPAPAPAPGPDAFQAAPIQPIVAQPYTQSAQPVQPVYQQPVYQQPMYQQPQQIIIQQAAPQPVYTAINPAWPVKSKVAAGVLGLFLGGIGAHNFYLGKIGTGLLCLLFCWTGIPSIIGFIEGIMILCSNDENFQLKYHVRAMM